MRRNKVVRAVVVRDVDVPLHAFVLRAEHEGVSAVGAQGTEVLLQKLRFPGEAPVKGLVKRAVERGPRVLGPARGHA